MATERELWHFETYGYTFSYDPDAGASVEEVNISKDEPWPEPMESLVARLMDERHAAGGDVDDSKFTADVIGHLIRHRAATVPPQTQVALSRIEALAHSRKDLVFEDEGTTYHVPWRLLRAYLGRRVRFALRGVLQDGPRTHDVDLWLYSNRQLPEYWVRTLADIPPQGHLNI
jgi:hypothetical protein